MAVRTRLAAAGARWDVRVLVALVAVEVILLSLFFLTSPNRLARPRYALYPFIWINASLWVVLQTNAPQAPRRHRLAAGTVAVGYLLVLCWLAGLIGPVPAGYTDRLVDLSVGLGSPGWERITLIVGDLSLTLVPFRVIGYLVLSYLVYVTALDAAGALVSGALGLFSCISCTFPVVVSLASGALGGSSAIFGAIFSYSTDLSTAVFLLSLVLLYYRPTFGRTAG